MPKGKGSGKGQGGRGKQSKTDRLEAQERKRDERSVRLANRNKRKDAAYLADDENYAGFSTQLQTMGLQLRDIPGDGNCLFRALGDQLEGHCRNHLQHRHDTVEYITDHRDNFEPFVEDDVPFDRHVANLSKSGTYGGNDSIVAFARHKKVNVVIHQLNNPVWKIIGCEVPGTKELHISYHNGDHYSSVRKYGDKSDNPTNFGLASTSPSKPTQNQQSTERHKKKQDKHKSSHETDGMPVGGASNVQESDLGAVGVVCNGGEMTDMEVEIMQTTGCEDLDLIRTALEGNFYDMESTVDFILTVTAGSSQVQDAVSEEEMKSLQTANHAPSDMDNSGTSSSLWSSEGTGTRLFGPQLDVGDSNIETTNNSKTEPNRTGNKQNQRLKQNTRQKNQQKRQEKKQRQMERHRQKVLEESSPSSATSNAKDEDNLSTVPLNELGALHI